jgi:hypothetical protein
MTYHKVYNKSNTVVQLVEQELLTHPKYRSSPLKLFLWKQVDILEENQLHHDK